MSSKSSKINELLTRGIKEIIPSGGALEKALNSTRKLTVYLGVDPTAPDLHLGHAAPLLLLKRFQKLGHTVVLLVGDFTAQVGDPSGKTTQRMPLAKKDVLANARQYKDQAAKILDFTSSENPATVALNSTWHDKLTFGEVLRIASLFTVQQMLARDMFQKRLEDARPIGLNEFLYPMAQGYDSVALKTDVEVGGSDQLFNMLVGRDLVKAQLGKEKFVVTTRLLVSPETGAKMSKSEGTFVAFTDRPGEMYGKIMAFPDSLIKDCFEFCTEVSLEEIEGIKKLHPKDAKSFLARTIVGMFHGNSEGEKAEREFQKVFRDRELPSDIPGIKLPKKKITQLDLLMATNFVSSRGEARRLIEQGGVHIRFPGAQVWKVLRDWKEEVDVEAGMMVRVGKRKIVKILT